MLGEGTRGGRILAGRDQQIGEESPASTEELGDPQAAMATDAEWDRADQATSSVGGVDGQVILATVVSPPIDKPAVQQEGARSRHRPDELVPGACEPCEIGLRGDGLQTEPWLGRVGHTSGRSCSEAGARGHLWLDQPQCNADPEPDGEEQNEHPEQECRLADRQPLDLDLLEAEPGVLRPL